MTKLEELLWGNAKIDETISKEKPADDTNVYVAKKIEGDVLCYNGFTGCI